MFVNVYRQFALFLYEIQWLNRVFTQCWSIMSRFLWNVTMFSDFTSDWWTFLCRQLWYNPYNSSSTTRFLYVPFREWCYCQSQVTNMIAWMPPCKSPGKSVHVVAKGWPIQSQSWSEANESSRSAAGHWQGSRQTSNLHKSTSPFPSEIGFEILYINCCFGFGNHILSGGFASGVSRPRWGSFERYKQHLLERSKI